MYVMYVCNVGNVRRLPSALSLVYLYKDCFLLTACTFCSHRTGCLDAHTAIIALVQQLLRGSDVLNLVLDLTTEGVLILLNL